MSDQYEELNDDVEQELEDELEDELEEELEDEYTGEFEGELDEETEMQLASELLEVSSEEELDYFIGKLFRRVVRGAKRFFRRSPFFIHFRTDIVILPPGGPGNEIYAIFVHRVKGFVLISRDKRPCC